MKKELYDYKWKEYGTAIYLIVMFLAFPLYFTNNYINILESKTTFFVAVTCTYLIAFIVLVWLDSIFKAEKERKLKSGAGKKHIKKKAPVRKILYQDVFFLVFVGAVLVSTIGSGDILNAWYSPDCKLFGTMIILLCCGIYFCVSEGYVINAAVKFSLIIGVGAVCILAVMNRYGIDPLQMQSSLIDKQKAIYISTIGNVNILSSFICIFIPLFIGAFLFSEKLVSQVVCGLLVYAGVMTGVATNSDSFFLGIGVSMIFFLWFCMESKEKSARYLTLCAVCSAAMISLNLFNRISSYDYVWKGFQSSLLNSVPWGIVLSVSITLTVLIIKFDFNINWIKIRKFIFIFIGVCFIVFILYLFKVNIFGGDNVSDKFVFNEEWGTNRGFVWIHTSELYRELPFYKQLTGIGPGGFSEFFEIYNIERAAQSYADFVDPHSEFLYYLVSTGFIGMTGYFGMITAAIAGCLRAGTKHTVILSAVFISWLAQGTVNNPLVFITPYLFIFLGMARHELLNVNNVESLFIKCGGKK